MPHKLKIIISDLHLGLEPAESVAGFSADAALANLLKQFQQESQQQNTEIELILNGDIFAFLQVPVVETYKPGRTYPPEAYQDSSAQASIKRLKLIANHHPLVFAALSEFLQLEPPLRRLTLIKGNHDPHLYWPDVKAALRQILGTTGERASLLLFAEEFINREGIYVEHGHQHTEPMNSYPNFGLPLDGRDRTQLYYPPGSQFLIHNLSQLGTEYNWLHQLKPTLCTLWYALKWDFDLATKLLLNFVQIFPEAKADTLNPNIARSLDYLLAQLQNPDDCEILAHNYAASSEGRKMLHQQIQALTHKARLHQKFEGVYQTEISDDPLQMAQAEQAMSQNALRARAKTLAQEGQATVFVFGHTHQPAFEAWADGYYFINTGSWTWTQETSDLSQQDTWLTLKGERDIALDQSHRPYALIHYNSAGHPQPQLLDFAGRGFAWESKGRLTGARNWLRRLFREPLP
jgi:UDP-2,3-diacylglucosamine pyrophosphatase LpxH